MEGGPWFGQACRIQVFQGSGLARCYAAGPTQKLLACPGWPERPPDGPFPNSSPNLILSHSHDTVSTNCILF